MATVDLITTAEWAEVRESIKKIDAKLDEMSEQLRITPSASQEEQLVDIKKAAETLGLSVATLRSWIQDGSISYRKVGKRVLFAKEDLRAIIEGGKINPIGD